MKAEIPYCKSCENGKELATIARGLNLEWDRRTTKEGFVLCSEIQVGETYILDRKFDGTGYKVKIIGGCYLDDTYGRVSNHWTWRRVKYNGELGEKESDYGGAFRPVPEEKPCDRAFDCFECQQECSEEKP